MRFQPMDVSKLRNQFRLYLITDGQLRPAREMASVVEKAIRGGVTAIQLREKQAQREQILRYLEALRPVCEKQGVPLILNAASWFPGIPTDLLDGVHLQSSSWSWQRQTLLGQWLDKNAGLLRIYSAHSVAEAEKVVPSGIPAITLSPIYPTPSKEGILSPLGVRAVDEARRKLPQTVLVALGGINASNAAEVISRGADGIALIRAIFDVPDVESAARSLREIVEKAVATRCSLA